MSGVDARDGFWFQDARILVRLLRDATARRLLVLGGLTVPPAIRIKIEAATEVPSDAASLATPRPLWDSVSLESTALIVDETKLGDVSKAERLSFYARLRGTAASRGSVAGVVPRLTTATGAQTNEEKWRGLAHASVAAPVPAAAPTTVNTADELAQEALFYLTSPQLPSRKRNNRGELVDAVTPQMPEPDARALLERFLFDDELDLSATESELRRLLEQVGANPLVDESVRHLRGWIAEKACARPEGAEMSCETLCDDLTIVARYLRVRPESERLLRRLRDARAPAIETRIPVREWRDVQPAVAGSVDSAGSTRVVLTGFGGLGKSFLLSQLEKDLRHADLCLWIDATSAVDVGLLAEAVELAAWLATHSGRRLSVLIDGLDQATVPLTLLSSVHEGLAGIANAIVVTAARPATWSTIAVTSDLWRAVHLERWSIESVTQLSFAPMLPPDLVDLLRTPLLLDLYLRTITNEDPKFFRPTSRHELIADYFLRRILPAGATFSPIRGRC